jgi:hypothetical protein
VSAHDAGVLRAAALHDPVSVGGIRRAQHRKTQPAVPETCHQDLETQMCSFVPDHLDGSPDRVDALVWALTELMLGSAGENLFEHYGDLQAQQKAADQALERFL